MEESVITKKKVEYPELTEYQEQAMFNFFLTRSIPRIIAEEKAKKKEEH